MSCSPQANISWWKADVTVEILCSEPGLAYRGEWHGDGSPEALLRRLIGEAKRRGIPIQLSVTGHGTWSIAPTGRVIRGALFLEKKLAKKRRGSA
jgi:hypothetical protein